MSELAQGSKAGLKQGTTKLVKEGITELGKDGMKEVGKKVIEEGTKEVGKEGMKVAMQEAGKKLIEEGTKEVGKEGMKVAMQEVGKKLIEEGAEEVVKEGMKVGMQQVGKKVIEGGTKELVKEGMKAGTKELVKEGLKKGMPEAGKEITKGVFTIFKEGYAARNLPLAKDCITDVAYHAGRQALRTVTPLITVKAVKHSLPLVRRPVPNNAPVVVAVPDHHQNVVNLEHIDPIIQNHAPEEEEKISIAEDIPQNGNPLQDNPLSNSNHALEEEEEKNVIVVDIPQNDFILQGNPENNIIMKERLKTAKRIYRDYIPNTGLDEIKKMIRVATRLSENTINRYVVKIQETDPSNSMINSSVSLTSPSITHSVSDVSSDYEILDIPLPSGQIVLNQLEVNPFP